MEIGENIFIDMINDVWERHYKAKSEDSGMTRKCLACGNYFDTTKTGRYKYCSEKCAKSKNNNNHSKDINTLRFNEPIQVELEAYGYSNGELVYDWGKCPNCGWNFENGDKDWKEPYCCHCGQKLHWFD